MADDRPQPDDSSSDYDDAALHALALKRVRQLLRGFDSAEIEDAAQDVMAAFTEWVRSVKLEKSAEAAVSGIARNVAAERIRARRREEALKRRVQHESLGARVDPEDDAEVLEAVQRVAFVVTSYYRIKRAGCLPLAEVKLSGGTLKDYAAQNRVSYLKVLKDWSLCKQLVLDALRKGRIRLEWPRPPKRKASND